MVVNVTDMVIACFLKQSIVGQAVECSVDEVESRI